MNEYVIFGVGDRTFGIQVSRVQQVVPAATLSRSADTSNAVEGYLNLRGQPVPVVDARKVLAIDQPPMRDTDFLIILRDGKQRLFSIRSNTEVELTSQAQAVETDNTERSTITQGLIRVDMQLVSLLNPAAVSPYSKQSADQD